MTKVKRMNATFDPPRLVADDPVFPKPKLAKEPAKFLIGRVPMPPGRPRPKRAKEEN